MSHTWILVANSSLARIFQAQNNHDLKEIQQLTHPESRMYVHDLVSDKQGRGFESSNANRHPMEPTTSPKEVEFATFAKELSAHLSLAHNEGKFTKLYIAAGPHFLGLLREKISAATIHLIAGQIDKDITHLEAKQIRAHFPDIL